LIWTKDEIPSLGRFRTVVWFMVPSFGHMIFDGAWTMDILARVHAAKWAFRQNLPSKELLGCLRFGF
jgi:hypothetical protein